MVHFPSHHPARYPPPVQFPVRILPLERLPKMVGIITHFLIDYGNSHSKLLGGQQIQQSHESYPLSGGRHDIQYALRKKNKSPMLSEIIHIMEYTLYIYLSVSVGYIVLFLPPLISSNKRNIPRLLSGNVLSSLFPPIKRMRSFTPASLPFCAKLIRQSFTT